MDPCFWLLAFKSCNLWHSFNRKLKASHKHGESKGKAHQRKEGHVQFYYFNQILQEKEEAYQLICSITSHWKKNKHLAANQSLPSRWENHTRI